MTVPQIVFPDAIFNLRELLRYYDREPDLAIAGWDRDDQSHPFAQYLTDVLDTGEVWVLERSTLHTIWVPPLDEKRIELAAWARALKERLSELVRDCGIVRVAHMRAALHEAVGRADLNRTEPGNRVLLTPNWRVPWLSRLDACSTGEVAGRESELLLVRLDSPVLIEGRQTREVRVQPAALVRLRAGELADGGPGVPLDPFQVGARFPWPELLGESGEGQFYLYQEGNHLLVLFDPRLEVRRVDAVQRGRAELALAVREGLLFLCGRFAGSPWFECPYNWNLVENPEARTIPPEVGPGTYLPLLVVLVDSASQRVLARRGIRLPPKFSKALHDALRAQAQAPGFDLAAFARLVERTREEFPSADDLAATARAACVIEPPGEQHALRN